MELIKRHALCKIFAEHEMGLRGSGLRILSQSLSAGGTSSVNNNLSAIAPEQPFRFKCHPGLACFNACCRDLNQFLYPYDILRLKKRLGLSSGEFLARFTTRHLGPESGLPIVSLKSTDALRLTCPFVTATGCSVYPDRPSSCRVYPLIRAVSRHRISGEVAEHFMLLREPHCLGFEGPAKQTVRQWIKNQGAEVYNQVNDRLMEIISLKNRLHPGPLDPKQQHLFYIALYDLDNFRSQLFNRELLNTDDADAQELAAARTDDTVLLEIAMARVKQMFFKS
jgi:Fe-S-cluster containining protein